MRRSLPFAGRAGLFSLVLAASSVLGHAADLAWPPVVAHTRPWTRWWWQGNIVNDADLSAAMQTYAEAGLGGLEVTPIYGVHGFEKQSIPFLSKDWVDRFGHTLKEGRRLGLGIDLATGTGWPFGGPWIDEPDSCKYLVHKVLEVKAGGTLEEPVSFTQAPIARAVGHKVKITDLKEPVSANPNLQGLALDQVRFPKPLPLQALMAYSAKGDVLDLTSKVGADGKLAWTAPADAGDWTLYALFQGWHGKQVERAAPGGEGNVIDHFSADALGHYLARFDAAFAGQDLSGLRGFFNDSYEVDDAAGQSDFTPRFFDEFQARRGYDLRRHLPALVSGPDSDEGKRVLHDYRETISDLLLDGFTKPWADWAKKHGGIIRNQSHGSPANILDLYAASDIPETEGEELMKITFASSAAHVSGKPLASAEACTWLDEHFVATLAQVRENVDRYFLGGINHICYHGTAFSPAGVPWPGFQFYAAVEFFPGNPFWNDFKALNAYVTRAQSFLQAGRADNDLLVLYTVHDTWTKPDKKGRLQHFYGPEGSTAQATGEALLGAGYTFDYVSDRQLQGAAPVEGGRVRTANGVAYRGVIVPPCDRIPVATMEKIAVLQKAGVPVVFQDKLPSDVPGLANLEAGQARVRELAAAFHPGMVSASGVKPESMVTQGLRFIRRAMDDGAVYFIKNTSTEPLDGWVGLREARKTAAIFDPMTSASGLAETRVNGEQGEVRLQLAPGAVVVVRTFDSAPDAAPAFAYWKKAGEPEPVKGPWEVSFTRGGPVLPEAVKIDELRSWTEFAGEAGQAFSGTAVYKLALPRPAAGVKAWQLDLGRVAESARVRVNGKEIAALIAAPFRVVIPAAALGEESNRLEVEVSNLAANRIADMDRKGQPWKIFYNTNVAAHRKENIGPDGVFTAARWQPLPSGLIGPVTLTPLE